MMAYVMLIKIHYNAATYTYLTSHKTTDSLSSIFVATYSPYARKYVATLTIWAHADSINLAQLLVFFFQLSLQSFNLLF